MPMRQNHIDPLLYGANFMEGLKLNFLAKTVVDNEAIQTTWPPVLYLDPNGGAKDVLLPAEASSKGLVFFIRNTADAAETLTVKDDSDTTTIIALAQAKAAMVHCDGTTWRTLSVLA